MKQSARRLSQRGVKPHVGCPFHRYSHILTFHRTACVSGDARRLPAVLALA